MSKHLPIVIILLIAAAIRLVGLGDVRWGVRPDETMYGYDGLSIARTGTDHRQTGHPPLYLRGQSSVWDNRTSVLYPYIVAGLFTVFPPTMFVERLPAAVAGIAIVWLVYLVVLQLWPERRTTGWVAAGLTAISPVAFFWGRIGHDVIFLPLFTLLLIWTILKTRRQSRWWFGVMCIGALSLYTYQAAKLVAPLIVLLGCWYVWPTLRRQWKYIISAAVIGLVAALPMIMTQIIHWHEVQGEFSKVSLIGHPGEWWRIPGEFWYFLTTHYLLSYVATYPFLLPFSIVGVWLLRTQRRIIWLFLGWLGIAVLPAMLTRLHVQGVDLQWRSFAVLGLFEIMSAVTIVAFYEHLRDAKIFHGIHRAYSGVLVAIFLMPIITLTWLLAGGGDTFCCMNYGRLEEAIQLIQEPQYANRPVVFQLTSYTLPDYVLWMTKYPPQDFLRGPVTWSTFQYPELGQGEHPTQFGRFTLCEVRDCPAAPADALYVVPSNIKVTGKTILSINVFAPQWAPTYPWPWKVVDSTISP